MIGKNNKHLKTTKEGTKVESYSIKKFKVGAASVVIGASIFLGAGAVAQASEEVSNDTTTDNTTNAGDKAEGALKAEAKPTVENTKESVVAGVAGKLGAEAPKAEAKLDTAILENYINKISANLESGKYAGKTDESVAVLKAELESAKATLAKATTQKELQTAYNKLVMTVNSKLRNKPVEKKDIPTVDTTNGKETVGKKAENTEKKSDSNSIENTGSNDSRNGKALDGNNAFRTEAVTNKKPVGNIPFSNAATKDIYVYKGEETNIELSVTDDSGKIKDIRVGEGSRGIDALGAAGSRINNQYGLTFSSQRNETDGIVATQDNPAKVTITGNISVPNNPTYTGKLVTRYLVAEDLDGAVFSEPTGNQENANPLPEGYFKLWVREQTQKYDIQAQTNEAGKIAVADVNNLSQADFEKIKNNIKITYNTADDARLLDKNGKLVENASNYIDTVTKQGDQIVVTYKDGSTDSVALTSVLRNNPLPTVKVPYSNQAEKQVYVYTGENTDLTFTANDDTTVKDMYLRGPGGVNWNNTTDFGFTTGKIDNGVVTGGGTISDNKQEATIKMTGKTNLNAGQQWTSFVVANDNDNFSSMPAGRNFNALDIDPDAKSKPGYIRFVVKDQTSKYDITAPTEKVAVADPDNVTEADLAKIQEKLKLEYSNNNDDANLADKKGKNVDDKDSKIQSVTKDDQGNLVVTYKDGSTDKRKLSEFVRKNPAPTVELPYSNLAEKQIYVYTGENTDLTFKAKDDTTVKDMYLRGPGDVNWNNTTDFGFSMGVVNNGVVTGGGTISDNKQEATIKMTGKTNLNAGQQWTSFVVANDNDNFSSMPAGRNFNALDIDPDAKSKPGYIRFVVKDQTSKYDITAPTEKVAVADPDNVTEADLAKIQEKLKLEYSNNNDDANLADKKGKNVDDKDSRIKSVTKDDQGNLVVTYKDGSTDKRKLSEFVSLDKQPAITAVNQAAENKIAEINKTPNATDEEKAAAIAKVNADKEKAVAAINDANVTTKDAIDKAQNAGTTAIAGDNPVVAKKAAAKADVEAARQAKANAINADKNLTQAEKDAALAKVTKAAEDATKAIDAATKDAAVDAAKGTGITELGKVNPIAKENAKEAIGNALTAKNNEIDGRKDLTQAEKDAAKVEAKKLADAELAKVNAQPDNAETAEAAAAAQKLVNDAEDKGVADVTSVYPIAKEQAKKAVADELANKEKELDARKDLTTEEKEAAKKEAQALAKKATDAINGQPAIADTSDKATAAQKAVDTAKDKGVAEVKAVNPEAKVKPAAKKAIEDKLAKQLEDIANTPDATDEEKAEAVKKATDAANKAKEAVDTVTTDAAVKTEKDKAVGEGDTKGTIDQAVPVVEDKPNARKAIDAQTEAKKKELDARTDLSPKAKEVLKAKADKIAKEAKKLVDAATKEADVNKIEEADRSAIRAVGDVNRPVDKVLVKDPSALKDEEKAKILEEVKKVNPTAREVKYNDEGNIEVTTENGDKGIIIPSKLVKTQDDLDNGKGGNDINKPLDKVIVKDPANLTPEEKAKIIAAVEAVNPNAIVTIDENGSVSVSTPEGRTSAIPATYLVRTQEDVAKAGAGNSNIVKPADKVVGEATDPAAQAKVEKKLRALNPEAKSVKFDGKGNATVTLNDGTTATIPAEDLFKSEAQAKEPNAGNDIVKPADKVVVDPAKGVDEAAKKAIEEKVKAVNPGATVVVDDKGNATVTTPEGKTAVIPASDLTKSPEEAAKPNAGNDVNTPADKTVVANPDSLTPEEKKAIEDKVKAVNPGATVVVDDKGNATVTTADGKKTAVIPASALTKTAEAAKLPNAGNDVNTPADKTVVANPDSLTPEEKKAIEDKVKAVNPGATVVVDDKGNATVTTADGKKTAVIPASALTKTAEAAKLPNAGNDVNTPADKTVVANPDSLTPEEKKAIEDKVKAVNPGATVVVDDKGNATVTTADGKKTAVIPASALTKTAEAAKLPNAGNDVNTPADKTVVANPDSLTPEEKKAIEDKVKAVNPGATVVVDDKGNATVTTADGKKTAVILASALTKTAEAAKLPNAGNDVNTPADKTVVANPDSLTPEEKKAIEDKVKAVNPGATVVVDDKGNATVTTADGKKTAVIPASALTKTAEAAKLPNAGNDVNTPADKTVVANPDSLTPEEKKAIEDKVKAVNPGATVVVDDKGNATVTTADGKKTAVILASALTKTAEAAKLPNAGNDVNTPADKTVVANPDSLTPEEKKAIEDKVKAVNPGATVVVDDKGNATVTTADGKKTAVIPASALTKTAEAAKLPNAGNDVNTPADKTVVANPDSLTPEEKKAIEDKVKAVNPGATVVVDDKGNATVTTADGKKTAVIPASALTKSPEEAAKPNAGNDVNTPADKTVVANPDSLTPEEKKAIEDKVKAVNPGATVVVDDKGNATVTTADGKKTAVIPASALTKTAEAAKLPNAGNDVNTPADKTVVANPDSLTPEEKKAIEDKVKAVNPGATVVVDDKGNATVTTADGKKTAVIPASALTKTAEAAKLPNAGNDVNTPADKTVVANPDSLTPEEKKAIEDKVKAVNPGATVVVDDKGNATVTTADGKKTAVIPASALTKTAEAAKLPNAGNDVNTPADKTVVANPDSLTPEEKKAIEDKVKAVNPGATVVVDDKGNATVTTADGKKTAVILASALTKTAEAAKLPNAGNDVNTPADKTVVANPDSLTPEEKKAIEDKVKAVNPGATVVVDDKGNATVTTADGKKTAVIPASALTKTAEAAKLPNAGNDVNTPADKTVVANPDSLTPEEKKAIEDKVKAVNPGATVVVDDKGNATVTTADGKKTAVILASALTKTAEAAKLPNAGNDVNTPADKTVVANPDSLTPEEKKAIEDKVKAVNPGATVVVDDKGNATVTTADGKKTAVIPASALTKTAEAAKLPNAGNDVNTPADKTVVANPDSLTPEEKKAIKDKVKAVNPGATVVVDDKGNATVTTADGKKTAVIPASNLVIPMDKLTDLSAQSGINTPARRTLVANKDSLTPEEIAKIKAAVEEVNPGATVVVDQKGNATVTTKDGKTATIAAEQLIKDAKDVATKNDGENINLDFEKQLVADLDNLTDADKAGAKAKIIAANPEVAEVIFDAKGNATVILKNGKSYTILAKDIFKKSKTESGKDINFPDKVQVVDPTNLTDAEKEAPTNKKLGQRLADTGTTETNTGLAGLGMAILGGLLAARRRKNNKN